MNRNGVFDITFYTGLVLFLIGMLVAHGPPYLSGPYNIVPTLSFFGSVALFLTGLIGKIFFRKKKTSNPQKVKIKLIKLLIITAAVITPTISLFLGSFGIYLDSPFFHPDKGCRPWTGFPFTFTEDCTNPWLPLGISNSDMSFYLLDVVFWYLIFVVVLFLYDRMKRGGRNE